MDHAIRQIISKALASEEIVGIFSAAGPKKPDMGEIKVRSQRNVVQASSSSELLEESVRRYQIRAIETAQVIEELMQLAKDMRAAAKRGEDLHLSEYQLAFYEALEVNDSALKVLGEPTLVKIARELVETVKRNVTIDWTQRENVRAQLRTPR